MTTAPSWLRAHPPGVLTWLPQAGASLERLLFEYLLLQEQATQTDTHALAKTLQQSTSTVARALFALLRNESLSVHVKPPASFAYRDGGLGQLQADLLELALPGQKLVLASQEGLCLASVGCTRYEAEVLAAAVGTLSATPHAHVLRFARGHIHLLASSAVDQRNSALLHLGRRLLALRGGLMHWGH